MTPNAIESLTPTEGEPDPENTGSEWTAWAMRKRLPSELAHRVGLRWPGDVAEMVGIPEATLRKLRSEGDHPRLFALGRAMFTTRDDMVAWLEAHELQPGQTVRPATIPRYMNAPRLRRLFRALTDRRGCSSISGLVAA